jgi:hypothetical protein
MWGERAVGRRVQDLLGALGLILMGLSLALERDSLGGLGRAFGIAALVTAGVPSGSNSIGQGSDA